MNEAVNSTVAASTATSGAEQVINHGPTAGEYIVHHLTHWNNIGHKQASLVDFSVIHIDTVLYSLLMGLISITFFYVVARKFTSGVPGRLQAAFEILYDMVNDQAKNIIHSEKSREFITPLAMTVFVWIFLMNAMDLLPLDLLPTIWSGIYGAAGHDPHHAYMRVVPTADIGAAMGMSLAVLLLCLYYNIKIKGIGGWVHELFTAPFGAHPLLYPLNFAMQIIEFIAKTVSHGMRLFGNMYAGELIFMLIALMGAAWAGTVGTGLVWVGSVIAGSIWAIFHILIITLQAFVFMMLALIYLGQAHDSH